ncbi:MAG: hypothetical protein U5L45_27035 [Saprospiraceae bacterium]|nr:hypothetical protein [Saprospiraceae bacterium]
MNHLSFLARAKRAQRRVMKSSDYLWHNFREVLENLVKKNA